MNDKKPVQDSGPWNFIRGQAHAKILSDQSLARECGEVLDALGLTLEPNEFELVIEKSIEFFQEAVGVRYVSGREWHRVGVVREMLRVLVAWKEDDIRRAHESGTKAELEEIATRVAAELALQGNLGLEARHPRLDVRTWNLHVHEGDSDSVRLRHLHLVAELARRQENELLAREEGRDRQVVLRAALKGSVELSDC